MNILMLTSIYPQPDDGLYKATPTVQYFCHQWIKDGHSVIVIHNNGVFPRFIYKLPRRFRFFLENHFQMQIPSFSSTKIITRLDDGVIVYRLPIVKHRLHGRFSKRRINKQGLRIVDILKKNSFEPDLIVGHWANPQAELISWLKHNYKHNYRTALVFHNDFDNKSIERYDLNYFLKDIDVVGCRNNQSSIRIKQLYSLTYKPFVCYSGLDNEIVKKSNVSTIIKSKNYKTLLYVGRLVKYKNVDAIIKAYKKIEDVFNLEIVGSGTEKGYLLNLISSLDIKKNILFIDKLSHEDVFDKMKESGIFVMISKDEVFGMVYLEAMLMGCIVIASRGCALDGVIENGKNGFLCNAGDENELLNILVKISKMSSTETFNISINAHNTARMFTDKNVANQYLNDIVSICNCANK